MIESSSLGCGWTNEWAGEQASNPSEPDVPLLGLTSASGGMRHRFRRLRRTHLGVGSRNSKRSRWFFSKLDWLSNFGFQWVLMSLPAASLNVTCQSKLQIPSYNSWWGREHRNDVDFEITSDSVARRVEKIRKFCGSTSHYTWCTRITSRTSCSLLRVHGTRI